MIILLYGDLLCRTINMEKVNENELKSIKSTHQWHSSYKQQLSLIVQGLHSAGHLNGSVSCQVLRRTDESDMRLYS